MRDSFQLNKCHEMTLKPPKWPPHSTSWMSRVYPQRETHKMAASGTHRRTWLVSRHWPGVHESPGGLVCTLGSSLWTHGWKERLGSQAFMNCSPLLTLYVIIDFLLLQLVFQGTQRCLQDKLLSLHFTLTTTLWSREGRWGSLFQLPRHPSFCHLQFHISADSGCSRNFKTIGRCLTQTQPIKVWLKAALQLDFSHHLPLENLELEIISGCFWMSCTHLMTVL